MAQAKQNSEILKIIMAVWYFCVQYIAAYITKKCYLKKMNDYIRTRGYIDGCVRYSKVKVLCK